MRMTQMKRTPRMIPWSTSSRRPVEQEDLNPDGELPYSPCHPTVRILFEFCRWAVRFFNGLNYFPMLQFRLTLMMTRATPATIVSSHQPVEASPESHQVWTLSHFSWSLVWKDKSTLHNVYWQFARRTSSLVSWTRVWPLIVQKKNLKSSVLVTRPEFQQRTRLTMTLTRTTLYQTKRTTMSLDSSASYSRKPCLNS